MNADVLADRIEQELIDIGQRWQAHWRSMQQTPTPGGPKRLDAALRWFLENETSDVPASPMRIDLIFQAIGRERTHTKVALEEARARLDNVPKVWTNGRRAGTAALAVWWSGLAGWEILYRSYLYYDRVPVEHLAWVIPTFVFVAYIALRWVVTGKGF